MNPLEKLKTAVNHPIAKYLPIVMGIGFASFPIFGILSMSVGPFSTLGRIFQTISTIGFLTAFCGIILIGVMGVLASRKAAAQALEEAGKNQPNTDPNSETPMLDGLADLARRGARFQGDLMNESLKRVDLKSAGEALKGEQNQQVVKIRCLSCNHLNDENDRFCGGCGAKLTA